MSSHSAVGWRSAFIAGVCLLILAVATRFGTGRILQVVSLLAILVAVTNALAGPDRSRRGNWIAHQCRRALSVTPFLKGMTVVVLIFSALLCVDAARLWYAESQRVVLTGTVLTPSGDPAYPADVIVGAAPEQRTTTNSQGRYHVELSRAESSLPVRVTARWRHIEETATIDTWARTVAVDIRIRQRAPFRVTYFRLTAPAIYLFLRGRFPPFLDKHFSRPPIVVETAAARLARRLTDFVIPIRHLEVAQALGTRFESVPAAVNVDLDGTIPVSAPYNTGPWGINVPEDDLEEVLRKRWFYWFDGQELSGQGKPDLYGLRLWHPFTTEDLALFEPTLPMHAAYMRELERLGLPDGFANVVLTAHGCGDYFGAAVHVPVLRLELALLENSSSTTIELGDFEVVESIRTDVRVHNPSSEREVTRRIGLYPRKQLTPGELLAIPLSTTFSVDNTIPGYDPRRSAATVPPEETSRQASLLESSLSDPVVEFPISTPEGRRFRVDSATMRSSLVAPAPIPASGQSFVAGGTLAIRSVDVDGLAYPFREPDWTHITLLGAYPVGSCPYVYTQSDRGWERQGTILTGVVGREHEREHSLRLSTFDGTILIREEEAEISYINQLHVRGFDGRGGTETLRCDDPALLSRDESYITLRPGDEFTVRCGRPTPGFTYVLTAHGYYTPLDPRHRHAMTLQK